mmetsp:Transcript_11071/g.16765  ORF Transcript_11071/g.16765 Transcript_11071/m.16765 type:complete len:250 (+) Transcript_11071:555-1304(+)
MHHHRCARKPRHAIILVFLLLLLLFIVIIASISFTNIIQWSFEMQHAFNGKHDTIHQTFAHQFTLRIQQIPQPLAFRCMRQQVQKLIRALHIIGAHSFQQLTPLINRCLLAQLLHAFAFLVATAAASIIIATATNLDGVIKLAQHIPHKAKHLFGARTTNTASHRIRTMSIGRQNVTKTRMSLLIKCPLKLDKIQIAHLAFLRKQRVIAMNALRNRCQMMLRLQLLLKQLVQIAITLAMLNIVVFKSER